MKKCLHLFTILLVFSTTSLMLMACDEPQWPEGLEDKYSVSELDAVNGKQMIHVEGTPYERGFAIGYEFPEQTMRNCSKEYYIAVVKSMFGDWVEPLTDMDRLVAFVMKSVLAVTKVHKKNIPQEYVEEMTGIVDGVHYAMPDADFDFDDVLMLNLSVDVLLSLEGDILDWLGVSPDAPAAATPHSCNGFVATGNATSDGGTIMGRHFMFPQDVFSETCLIIEYVPENGYPFVSVTPPGYVGATAAMNNQGIGIGQDMLFGAPTAYAQVGMGRLLLARNAVQYAGTLQEAVAMFQSADIADGNLFIIGDGKGDGAVVECHAEAMAVRYLDSTYATSDYLDPSYHEQIEDKDDLVLVTNHAVTPEIANTSAGNDNSLSRYKELNALLLGAYGNLNVANSRDIIDFLHPPSWYYGEDPDQPVAASVNLFDLTNLQVWSLYGHYNDTWVSHQLNY